MAFARVKKHQNQKKAGTSGAATNFVSRNIAIRKLQISLAQFRRLCIIKGIYPREPRNKKKVNKGSTAPRTVYYKKDIQFLLHEPILHKLREIRAHQQKINRAIGKEEWAVAKSLEESKPEYRLDHIIRERYPSFNLAVRDLDDALSMIALFATLPTHSRVIKPSIIRKCARLISEFQHYVTLTGRLKKVFVSIKGIYYQADIGGSDVTWIVPHPFSQDTPRDVDFRIMATFLDLYETLVGFVNYKLYNDLNLAYPPKVKDEETSSGLAGFTVETVDGKGFLNSKDDSSASGAVNRKQRKEVEKRVKTLSDKIGQISKAAAANANDGDDEEEDEEEIDEDADIPSAIVEPTDASEMVPSLKDAAKIVTGSNSHKLFHSCVFFLSREVPRQSLEFVIKSFGGKVGWPETSGSGANVAENDPTITHQIVDRPIVAGANHGTRDFIQPQWVYDCVNAGKILRTKGYHIGETLPAHLSPFGGGKEGYVPAEAVSALAASKGIEANADEEGDIVVGGIMADEAGEDAEGDENDDVEDDGEEEDELKGPLDSDDEEEVYQAELEAEAAGLSFTEYMQKKAAEGKTTKKAAAAAPATNKKRKAEAEAAEEKALAMTMMNKKDRNLYHKIEYGRKKKEEEAKKLLDRRIAHQKQEAANKKGGAKSDKPAAKKSRKA
ncbi:UNVERIFIED_CONTAM: mRNA-binding ribosome synthesis protein nop7 [Siphonaria sp. JEL0065]|nr:mRNA-binding ribosome synthesis protein nop7 [Siphonaria sp. JEL0065]